jgi:hypothetical protein
MRPAAQEKLRNEIALYTLLWARRKGIRRFIHQSAPPTEFRRAAIEGATAAGAIPPPPSRGSATDGGADEPPSL